MSRIRKSVAGIHLGTQDEGEESCLYGIGMPTKDAIRKTLQKVGACNDSKKTFLWTSLREEPVIYVNGRPYVLRLFQDPMKVICYSEDAVGN